MGFFVGKADSLPLGGMEDYEEANYSYGKVLSVKPEEIVIQEYDYEKDQEVDVVYLIDSSTEFQNIAASGDLTSGEEVEIYYNVKNGKKMASIITRPQIEDDDTETDNEEEKGDAK